MEQSTDQKQEFLKLFNSKISSWHSTLDLLVRKKFRIETEIKNVKKRISKVKNNKDFRLKLKSTLESYFTLPNLVINETVLTEDSEAVKLLKELDNLETKLFEKFSIDLNLKSVLTQK